MRKASVIKAFPFAFDGINMVYLAKGSNFPPLGWTAISDTAFDGLVSAGFLKEVDPKALPGEEALNREIIAALDKRLSDASDEDLKGIVARSGTPYSGDMVRAHLALAAKRQLLAEAQGTSPIIGINPNAGVTEQPLSAPGQATPPSAAAAVEHQNAEADAANAAAGENKATNQFGDPVLGGGQPAATDEVKLDEMTVAELKALAEKRDIDLGDATTKAKIVEAIKAAGKA